MSEETTPSNNKGQPLCFEEIHDIHDMLHGTKCDIVVWIIASMILFALVIAYEIIGAIAMTTMISQGLVATGWDVHMNPCFLPLVIAIVWSTIITLCLCWMYKVLIDYRKSVMRQKYETERHYVEKLSSIWADSLRRQNPSSGAKAQHAVKVYEVNMKFIGTNEGGEK